jgi:hypothetical protein
MAQASGQFVTLGTATVTSGEGVPAGTDAKGSLYLNTTGSSTSTRAYIQTVSGSTTGWTAVTTAA